MRSACPFPPLLNCLAIAALTRRDPWPLFRTNLRIAWYAAPLERDLCPAEVGLFAIVGTTWSKEGGRRNMADIMIYQFHLKILNVGPSYICFCVRKYDFFNVPFCNMDELARWMHGRWPPAGTKKIPQKFPMVPHMCNHMCIWRRSPYLAFFLALPEGPTTRWTCSTFWVPVNQWL